MASQGPIYSIGYLAIVEDPVPASQRASVATPFNVRELPRTVYPESVATLSSTTSATTSAGTTPAEENSAEEPKPPPRVYPLYSWRTQAPNTRLVYIRDLQTAETEVARLKPGPLGFDLEWKPNWQKGQQENPVALVQLASEDTVLLIQVSAIRVFPDGLRNLLWNPAYLKAGVGIHGDCKKLWNDWRVNVRNCVDLALLARTVDNARWKGKYVQPIGLQRLCETYEELTLTKGRITRSNWEAYLSEAQQEYAANDSHSGLTLYKRLHPLTKTVDPIPLPAFYSFDLFEGIAYEPTVDTAPHMIWHPHNPFYDPGPPPPPKPPGEKKERRDRKGRQRQEGVDGTPSADGGASGQAVRLPRNADAQSAEGSAAGQRPYAARGRGRGGQAHRGFQRGSHPQHASGQRGGPSAAGQAYALPGADAGQGYLGRPDDGVFRGGHRGRPRGRGRGGQRGGGGFVPPPPM